MSPSSVCQIVREVMTAICQKMEDRFLKEPQDSSEWKKIAEDFERKWSFPLCCGAIDGKHVRITSPRHSGSIYYNYKNYYSVVLLAVADANYKFIMVDIGASGSISDGGVLKNSQLGKKLEENKFKFPNPQVRNNGFRPFPALVGDDAFPLKKNLLKPYPGKHLQFSSKIFNYRLSRARMVIENSFGILAARWRIFQKPIQADLTLVKLVVKTCVILHNFLIDQNDTNGLTFDREENGEEIRGNWRSSTNQDTGMININHQGSNNATAEAFQIRDNYREYFISNDGKLQWQETYVMRGYNS
jgi:DDE superfamily endonuclease